MRRFRSEITEYEFSPIDCYFSLETKDVWSVNKYHTVYLTMTPDLSQKMFQCLNETTN